MADNKQQLIVDEITKEICYWNTQIQLKPDNMELIANNLYLKFSKFFKKKYWDYQYELMCLNSAIAYLALKRVFSDSEEEYDKEWDEYYDDDYDLAGKIRSPCVRIVVA